MSFPSSQFYRRGLYAASSSPYSTTRAPNPRQTIPTQQSQRDYGSSSSYHRINPRPLQEPVPGVELYRTYLAIDVDGKRMFDFAQLRDACKCPICVDQYSKQRNFRSSDIPLSIEPREIKWDGQKLEIQWSHDIKGYDASHTSTFDRAFLESPIEYSVDDTSKQRWRYLWSGPNMQELQHWISYEDYMTDDAKFADAMRNLSATGLIFVKNIPESREEMEKIIARIGPLRNTFYGRTWDVRTVPEAKNVAYTNVFLGFHMDLMYMNEPPCFQLLHCLQNSCDGGESMFADSFLAASRLRELRPEYFKILERFPVNYEYVHQDQIYHNSWPVIETRRSMTPDGYPRQIHRVNYSPPFQGPLRAARPATWGSNYRQFREALSFFTDLLEQEDASFELKLNPGECAIFENRRVLHARRQFNTSSGQRWLVGGYIDEDVLLSRYRVCKRDYPEVWDKLIGSDGIETVDMRKFSGEDARNAI